MEEYMDEGIPIGFCHERVFKEWFKWTGKYKTLSEAISKLTKNTHFPHTQYRYIYKYSQNTGGSDYNQKILRIRYKFHHFGSRKVQVF